MAETTELLKPAEYVLGDIVAAVITLTPEHLDCFTGDTIRIHKTFHELRDKFPILQGRLAFTLQGPNPLSPQLEESLVALEISRIIGMDNPDFTQYRIKKKGREFVKSHIFPLFTEVEQAQLQQMAEIFASECGESRQAQ